MIIYRQWSYHSAILDLNNGALLLVCTDVIIPYTYLHNGRSIVPNSVHTAQIHTRFPCHLQTSARCISLHIMNGIPGTAEKGPSVRNNTCLPDNRDSVQWNCETKHQLQGRTKSVVCCRANNLAEKKQGILIDSSFFATTRHSQSGCLQG